MTGKGVVYPSVARWLRRWDARTGSRRVLDCGAGAGQYVRVFEPGRYVGIDLAETWYEPAHQLSANADAARLPFRDRSFGLAFAVAAFDYFDQQREVLVELKRCLDDGGAILLFLWPFAVQQRIAGDCARLPPSRARAGHRPVDAAWLEDAAAAVGLTVRQLRVDPVLGMASARASVGRPVLRPHVLRRHRDGVGRR